MQSDQSSITYGQGFTTFSGPDAVAMYRAAALASALRLYASCGMIPTRGVTITKMLGMASKITGKKYKRGEAVKAADDVTTWAREMKAALPQIIEGACDTFRSDGRGCCVNCGHFHGTKCEG